MLTKFIKFVKNLGQEKSNDSSLTYKVDIKVSDYEHIHSVYKENLKCGLLPGEIVLLNWLDGSNMDGNYPRYFKYTYGLNAKKSAMKLIERNYLKLASPSEALSSLTVAQLKEILKEHDLKLAGRKNELIERVNNNLSHEVLKEHIKETPLKLTTLGIELLKEYYYIVPAHKMDSKDGVYNVASAIEYLNNFKGDYHPSNSDISWDLFSKAYEINIQSKMFGLARSNILSMAEQLYRENKSEDSLIHYLRVFIMDLSGMGNGSLNRPSITVIAPGIISRIKNIIDFLELSNDNISQKFKKAWNTTKSSIPFHYLNESKCFTCLEKSLAEDNDYVYKAIADSYEKLNKVQFEKQYGMYFPEKL